MKQKTLPCICKDEEKSIEVGQMEYEKTNKGDTIMLWMSDHEEIPFQRETIKPEFQNPIE